MAGRVINPTTRGMRGIGREFCHRAHLLCQLFRAQSRLGFLVSELIFEVALAELGEFFAANRGPEVLAHAQTVTLGLAALNPGALEHGQSLVVGRHWLEELEADFFRDGDSLEANPALPE